MSDGPLFEGIEANRQEAEKSRRVIQSAMATLEVKNRKAKDKLSRLLDVMLEGEMDHETYYAKKRELTDDIKRREDEIQDYEKRLAEYRVISPEQEAELREYRAKIAKGLDPATFEDKRKYLEWLQVQCIYDAATKELTVTGILGNASLTVKSSSADRTAPRVC